MTAALLAAALAFAPPPAEPPPPTDLPMSGEVTATSAIVQTRAVPGTAGRFQLMPVDPLADASFGESRTATADRDGIVRERLDGLLPGTVYRYRWTPDDGEPGRTGTFRTLPGPDPAEPVEFVVVTGLNYARFRDSDAPKSEKALGYPMLERIRQVDPHFVVFTGDTVYYDTPTEGRATTWPGMRAKWHEQFAQPRFRDLLAAVPAFHMKDDHDFRKDDADRTGNYEPSPELGIEVFREQVPVVPTGDDETPTYRTVRANRDLQIWLVEGRDYRSPNDMPDGPGKTLWGEEQFDWLTRTLAESDATFKVLISPTPLVGPDDKRKTDNHADIGGFRHERGRFFDFLEAEGMIDSGEFVLICGDRHWQYHATHPTGVEEFSSGAIHRSNARPGREAGDPQSTDPDGDIVQHYLMGHETLRGEDGAVIRQGSKPRGGFLHVRAEREDGEPVLRFRYEIGRTTPAADGALGKIAYKTVHRRKDTE